MEKKFKKLTGVVPLKIAEVGDCVQFGKIAWKVIGIESDKKLLLSKDCLSIDIEWELGTENQTDSTESIESMLSDILTETKLDYVAEFNHLKEYFSEWFCEKYFSQNVLERIIPHCIKANNSSEKPFEDYVFILSEAEVEKYIPKKEDRIATIGYDSDDDDILDYIFEEIISKVKRPWLLRSDDPADYQIVVEIDGEIEKIPIGCICDTFRPAVWVK